jgi:hypothetical protein
MTWFMDGEIETSSSSSKVENIALEIVQKTVGRVRGGKLIRSDYYKISNFKKALKSLNCRNIVLPRVHNHPLLVMVGIYPFTDPKACTSALGSDTCKLAFAYCCYCWAAEEPAGAVTGNEALRYSPDKITERLITIHTTRNLFLEGNPLCTCCYSY